MIANDEVGATRVERPGRATRSGAAAQMTAEPESESEPEPEPPDDARFRAARRHYTLCLCAVLWCHFGFFCEPQVCPASPSIQARPAAVPLTAYCRHLCLLVADGMSPLNLPVAKAFGSETEYIGGAFLIGSGIMLTFSERPPSIGLP